MNSFNTSEETLAFFGNYPILGQPRQLELMQGLVPKVDANTMKPVSWPANPQLEWCPPGHGDIYPSLVVSGWLERLLGEGVRYAFVSNSDNLGASLDVRLLTYFAQSGKPFIMEVTERTEADKKGGHLARYHDGRFLLRESVQCPEADLAQFQDIRRHRFFNTNNLWIRLDHLQEVLEQNKGIVPLPLIKNAKTVDPREKKSPAVYQLETAMGAAIESFKNSGAVNVPRTRFAPVKTTADLLTLRSDACDVTPDWRIVLAPELRGQPPAIDLDGDHYKLVDQLDALVRSVPSLKACRRLTVRGPVEFGTGITLRGNVEIVNAAKEPKALTPGVYADQAINLT
jgi:UDP-N-acetylglucosamine pyrophosphorylase